MDEKEGLCEGTLVECSGGGEGASGVGALAVWVKYADGEVDELEREVALLSPFLRELVLLDGVGSHDEPLQLPKQVGPEVLNLIMDYCRFHRAAGRSDKERKLFDERFIRLDTRRLCELTSAADALGMKSLVDLTSRALARMIEGKTPEEIRETFHLPDDLTEEEKLEPVRTSTDDPRIRLLNRLYARKRKELQDRKALRDGTDAEQQAGDARSVDELLNFIDGEGQRDASAKAKQKKKKGKKRGGKGATPEEQAGDEPEADDAQRVGAALPRMRLGASSLGQPPASLQELFPEDGFDDDDAELGSDLDPELLEKLDKEVEDFARRLNTSWRSPAAAPAAKGLAQPAGAVDSLAGGVQVALSSLIRSLGLSKTLQVVAASKQGGTVASAESWDADHTASARVPGGMLTVRVVSQFVPDAKDP